MRYSSQVKPISYLKAHTAEVVRQLTERREPLVITQNGEAKVVIQDVATYEETQETLALLKILALGERQIEEGKTEDAIAQFTALLSDQESPGGLRARAEQMIVALGGTVTLIARREALLQDANAPGFEIPSAAKV